IERSHHRNLTLEIDISGPDTSSFSFYAVPVEFSSQYTSLLDATPIDIGSNVGKKTLFNIFSIST
ncbi:hypothetical protein ElyMa_000644500, partial [Elysia marginata]